jgi:hypothetical protein|tara:strand:+ start:68 stop:349 length:282 start_codon:yes stop_codon:yes gene_type:complete
MFNNQTKEDKMSEVKDKKDIWLVIEKYVYSNSTPSHSVKKTATSVEEAIGFKLALEKLNEQQDVSYFLASDVDTVMDQVISSHNQSVKTKEVV